jgi:hypothetical protein
VGEQLGLHPVRKSSDGAGSSGYLSRILAGLASGCGDKQAKDPDCSLVGVTSLGNPIHRSLGVAADNGKLSAQASIQAPAFTCHAHRSKVGFDRRCRSQHQFERQIAVGPGTAPVNQSGLWGKLSLSGECLACQGGDAIWAPQVAYGATRVIGAWFIRYG